MINHLNSILIEGVMVNDPEVVATVKTQPDVKLVKFTLASDYIYVGADKEKKKDTLFIPIQVWGSLAEKCLKQMKKGMSARCVGRLKARSWNDEEGHKHTVVEVLAKHLEFKASKKHQMEVLDLSKEEEEKLGEPEVYYVI